MGAAVEVEAVAVVVAPVAVALGPICDDPICARFAASRASVLLGDSSPAVVSASTSFAGVFFLS